MCSIPKSHKHWRGFCVSCRWFNKLKDPIFISCWILPCFTIDRDRTNRVTRKLSKVPKFSSVGNVPPSWLHLPADFVFNLSALRETIQIYGDKLFYKKSFSYTNIVLRLFLITVFRHQSFLLMCDNSVQISFFSFVFLQYSFLTKKSEENEWVQGLHCIQ